MRSSCRLLAAIACFFAVFTSALPAQSSSGTITGRVLDSTGRTAPDATLTLTKTDTLDVRTFTTTPTGDFVFTALQPGPYTLKVQASGFKLVEKTDLNLSASERLPAGDIVLQVGSIGETRTSIGSSRHVQWRSRRSGAGSGYHVNSTLWRTTKAA